MKHYLVMFPFSIQEFHQSLFTLSHTIEVETCFYQDQMFLIRVLITQWRWILINIWLKRCSQLGIPFVRARTNWKIGSFELFQFWIFQKARVERFLSEIPIWASNSSSLWVLYLSWTLVSFNYCNLFCREAMDRFLLWYYLMRLDNVATIRCCCEIAKKI